MRRWLPLLALCLGTVQLLVDVTIVNVALPQMALALHTSFSSLQWVVDGYALSLAALLLGIGSLADLSGHRRVYVAGLAVFAAASFACGISPSPAVLITARIVQGLGGAAMLATTFALLNESYHGRDRGTAYGVWGAVAGASAAIGPIVGGILTEGISWRWIFFVNLPISAAAIVLSLAVLDPGRPERGRQVDLPDTVALNAALGCVTFGLSTSTDHGWTAPRTWSMFVSSTGSVRRRRPGSTWPSWLPASSA